MNIKTSNIVFLSLIFLFVFMRCDSDNGLYISPEPTIQFVKTMGGSLNDSGKSIIKTTDGGYIILGYTQSSDGDIINKENDSFDFWLLKYNSDDILEWQKTYGGTNDDRGNSIIQTSDGGYVMLGYSKSNDGDVSENNGYNDFWVSKLNTSGDILWQKSFGYSGVDEGISIIETSDNGFLLSGVLDVLASGGQGESKNIISKRHSGGDFWVIKLNASGTKEWSRLYGGNSAETPYDIIQTADNNYIIVGTSDSNDVDITNNKGSYDFWVIKISETGALIWEKSFGGSQIDEAYGITNSGDGNYVIVGNTRSSDIDIKKNKGAADLWLIKIASNGALIWQKTFGGTGFDGVQDIFKTPDNEFVISGNSRSTDADLTSNKGQNDAWILKVDASANLVWQKTVGGSNIDLAFDSVQLDNGVIISVGETSSNDLDIKENKGFTDLLIIKITE